MSVERPMSGRGDEGEEIAYHNRRQIGSFVKHMRKLRGMTQKELGEALGGISNTAVSAIEVGRNTLPPEKFERLCEVLDIEREWLGRFLLRFLNPWIYVLLYGTSTIPELPPPRRRWSDDDG